MTRRGRVRGPARVSLAVPRASDRAAFLQLNRASIRFHRGRATPPTTPAQFSRYLAHAKAPGNLGLLIRAKAGGAIVGAVEISQIAMGPFRSGYLGYYIGAPFARQGFMREALLQTLDLAFHRLRLHRLEANIQPTNRASRGLVRDLGFTREGYSRRYLKVSGRWRDHERWAILAEDWRAGRKR